MDNSTHIVLITHDNRSAFTKMRAEIVKGATFVVKEELNNVISPLAAGAADGVVLTNSRKAGIIYFRLALEFGARGPIM